MFHQWGAQEVSQVKRYPGSASGGYNGCDETIAGHLFANMGIMVKLINDYIM